MTTNLSQHNKEITKKWLKLKSWFGLWRNRHLTWTLKIYYQHGGWSSKSSNSLLSHYYYWFILQRWLIFVLSECVVNDKNSHNILFPLLIYWRFHDSMKIPWFEDDMISEVGSVWLIRNGLLVQNQATNKRKRNLG